MTDHTRDLLLIIAVHLLMRPLSESCPQMGKDILENFDGILRQAINEVVAKYGTLAPC